jgi:hypothetical protein
MKKKGVLFFTILVLISMFVLPSALAGADPGDGKAAGWHLDEGSGSTIFDSSGNGHDGTINGAAWYPDGRTGRALSFNGVDDYVQLPPANQILNGDAFTVHLWFKTNVNHPVYGGTEGRLVNFHRVDPGNNSMSALALYVEENKVGLLYYNENNTHVWVKYDACYYDDIWHSLAVTHDMSMYRLYLDGIEVASQNDTFSDFGSMNALMGSYDGMSRFYNGVLDEVNIWNRTLSADEIAALQSPETPMAQFDVKHALINFTTEDKEDKINMQGALKPDLVNGNGVDVSEPVTVTIGTLTETIFMTEKGRKNNKWSYVRPPWSNGNIMNMTINWKNGNYEIRIDRADLSGMNDPHSVLVSILVGDDLGETELVMREKKLWQYNGH